VLLDNLLRGLLVQNKITLFIIGIVWGFLIHTSFVYPVQRSNNELTPYVNAYYDKFVSRCPAKKELKDVNYTIKFKSSGDENWIGVCMPRFNGYEINIDPGWWEQNGPLAREQLVSHELTHCVLDMMGHSEDKHNYMYYMENDIPAEEFHRQLEVDMDNYCLE